MKKIFKALIERLGLILVFVFLINEVNALVRVIDGDTIKIDDISVRLQGVDAPEIKQKCIDKKGIREWDCGKCAKSFVEGLVAGREVECRFEEKVDKYGRSIGICLADGIEINKEIVKAGYGIAYTKYSQLYEKEELYAKTNKQGIWSGKFIKPEIYRRRKSNPIHRKSIN